MKGITPVISIVILVLIVISIAGAGYVFITGLEDSLTSKAIQISGSYCSMGVANIVIRNIGKDQIFLPTDLAQDEFDSDENTLLLLHLNEESGITAYDSSPYGHDGTLNNMNDDDWVTGKFDNALEFVASEFFPQYILPSITTFNVNDRDFTVEAWIKTDSDGLILQGGAVGSGGFALYVHDSYLKFSLKRAGGGAYPPIVVNSTTVVTDNEWHYVAGKVEPSQLEVYVDGELKATKTGDYLLNDPSGVTIGATNANPPSNDYTAKFAFDGIIDEIRVSNTSREISPGIEGLYMCDGSDCNEITAEKTSGGSDSVFYFDRTEINPGGVAIFKNSCTEICQYSILLGGRTSKASVWC